MVESTKQKVVKYKVGLAIIVNLFKKYQRRNSYVNFVYTKHTQHMLKGNMSQKFMEYKCKVEIVCYNK